MTPLLPSKIRFFFCFFTEEPGLESSGLCLSVFKEHSDEVHMRVFQKIESTNSLFQEQNVLVKKGEGGGVLKDNSRNFFLCDKL